MAQSEDCASFESHNIPMIPIFQLVNGTGRVWGGGV